MKKDNFILDGRACILYADEAPEQLLIQPTDENEEKMLDSEISHIRALTDRPFAFACFRIYDWNSELSPWQAPPVFGDAPFGSGAGATLEFIEKRLIPELTGRLSVDSIPVVLGGYSLAGLFALWAGYTSGRFAAVAAASPSVWFPGWTDFVKEHSPQTGFVYLSLGTREEKTRNRIMAAVGDNLRLNYELLKAQGAGCVLEWNEGNHFSQPDLRTAKGFAGCVTSPALRSGGV